MEVESRVGMKELLRKTFVLAWPWTCAFKIGDIERKLEQIDEYKRLKEEQMPYVATLMLWIISLSLIFLAVKDYIRWWQ